MVPYLVTFSSSHHGMCQKQMIEETDFRGKGSVRFKEGKMLFIFGYDDAIFKQYFFIIKSWVGSSKETAIIFKDEGIGVKIPTLHTGK